jgi:hypothetical protein
MHYAGPPRADAGPWTDGFPGAYFHGTEIWGGTCAPPQKVFDFLYVNDAFWRVIV